MTTAPKFWYCIIRDVKRNVITSNQFVVRILTKNDKSLGWQRFRTSLGPYRKSSFFPQSVPLPSEQRRLRIQRKRQEVP
jgi:hypothetical protein